MNLGKPKVVDEEVITWYHVWTSLLHEDSFTDLGPICTVDNVLTKSVPRACGPLVTLTCLDGDGRPLVLTIYD